MTKKEILMSIEKEAQKYFEGASGCHDWTHVERVRNLALKIGEKEKADLFLLEIASLLHDIGRKKEMKKKGLFCHAERGAELARVILENYNLSEQQIENIIHSIITHRFRNSHIPETIEAKVLFDSDKLDSIGAIGVARTFLFAGNAGSNTMYTGNEVELAKSDVDYSYTNEDSGYLEYEVKLKKVKDKILTNTGKLLAQARHDYMKKYFETFWDEIKGNI